MPYRYIEDIATADVAFEAWGGSLEELFISAGEALLATMVENGAEVAPQEEIGLELEEAEQDLLLWSFLQELVFHKDASRLLLHAESIAVERVGESFTLKATARGERIDPARHRLLVDVKAVTLHRFSLEFRDGVWRATVVLDV